MPSSSNTNSKRGSTVHLDVPARNPELFRSRAVHDVLSFLCRHHTDSFSITELTDAVDYSQPTISKGIDVLAANNLVVDKREGTKRTVHINRDRLSRPDDPFLEIPQAEFHDPVRAAVDELRNELDEVLGIVLYGSVARGEADRRSDIDLWVLVADNRMAKQRTANRVRQDLEDSEFDTGRYAYEIDVEALPAIPNYTEEIRTILSDGLILYNTEKFDTVQQMIFHGDLDE